MTCCAPSAPCRRCELWERYAAGVPIAYLRPCILCEDWWGAADLDERTRLCPACRAEILDAVEHEPPEPECDVQELARRVQERRRREFEEARARLAERGGLPGDPLRAPAR